MKKHKEEKSESTRFDEEESVHDSALAEEQEGTSEPKPIDQDESVGNSGMESPGQ